MIYKASSLTHALDIAMNMQKTGAANWFRGQARDWPMLSSFSRRDEAGREAAMERLNDFFYWLGESPELQSIVNDMDAALSVAQHYGIPTNLIDFSTEPRVAAFFAAHDSPPVEHENDRGCIICLDTNELTEFWQGLSVAKPTWPEPRQVFVNVPELWRIQAQRGVFLFYPYDEGFERTIFDFDRILFPAEISPEEVEALIPVSDIYPSQKSDLEILLDQYFMIERLREGTNRVEAILGDQFFPLQYESPPEGIEIECFGADGLPPHDSWNETNTKDWKQPAEESWTALSGAPELVVRCVSNLRAPDLIESLAQQFLSAIQNQPNLRKAPAKWKVVDFPVSEASDIEEFLFLLWDGLRRWPYADEDVAYGMATAATFGTLVTQNPRARTEAFEAEKVAAQCFGDAIEVEVGMSDDSYSRGYAGREELFRAARTDLATYLNDEWRPQITKITPMLQVVASPRHLFDFKLLARVFARQIAPTQVVLRGPATGKARVYNPLRLVRLGLP